MVQLNKIMIEDPGDANPDPDPTVNINRIQILPFEKQHGSETDLWKCTLIFFLQYKVNVMEILLLDYNFSQ